MAERIFTEVFIRLLDVSISAGWLILAILLVRLLFWRAPGWLSLLLWGVVALRLVMPLSVESVLSLLPSKQTVSPEIVYMEHPVIHSGLSYLNNAVNPVLSQSFAPAPGDSVNPLQIYGFLAALLWLAGTLAMLTYMGVSYVRLRRRVRGAEEISPGVYRSEAVGSPFVLGLFRPRIYLPFGLSSAELPFVLAHERAHIQRRDHLIKPFGFLLLSVYWFQPLLWVAYVLLCRDVELGADEKVIRDMVGEDRAAYSETLLAAASRQKIISACPLAFGEVGIKTRVKHVLSYKKPAFWILLLAVLVSVSVAVGFLTVPPAPKMPDVTSHAFGVSKVVYVYPVDADWIRPGVNTPFYTVTETWVLLDKSSADKNEPWYAVGTLTPFTLTKENFDEKVLYGEAGWQEEYTAAGIRGKNGEAYRLAREDGTFWYLLLQTDGEVYMGTGQNEELRYIYLLEKDVHEDTGFIAVSGESVVPLILTGTDTPISEIRELGLYHLPIVPGSATVPFQIFCDGNEQYGWYSVYDAETLEPLDFFRPSGLSPQTYVFQNAVPGRSYVVTARLAVDITACFIADIPGEKAVYERYSFMDSAAKVMKPSVTLYTDGSCMITFSAVSSYLGIGTYEIREGVLTIRTDDGEFTYVFLKADGELIFDGEKSSSMVWFSDVRDGSVFKQVYAKK